MAKISVVVPIYNVEKYLRKCLDSLIHQTFKDIEIICVNDGSKDSSLDIINEYASKDKRIKVISKENSGYGHTMNVGIDSATSEYIAILEADDFVEANMYEELCELITKNDCDIVKSNYNLYWSNPEKIIKCDATKIVEKNTIINAKEDADVLKLLPSLWTSLYKKEFLVKNNIRFLETPGASYQDTSFWHKVAMCAERVIVTDKAYIYYRQDNENSSVKNKGKMYCIVDEYKETLSFIEKNPHLNCHKQYIYALQYIGYCWNLQRLADELKEEFFEYFYNVFKKYYDNGELKKEFYQGVGNARKFMCLINSPKKFFKKYAKKQKPNFLKELKRKIISVSYKKGKLNLTLFGKKVIG